VTPLRPSAPESLAGILATPMQPIPGSFLSSELARAGLSYPPRIPTMSCSTLAIIAGGIIATLLWWACSQSAIAKYERDQQHFRKWQKRQEREGDPTSPEDPE